MLEQVTIPAGLYNWIHSYLNSRPRAEVNEAMNALEALVNEQAKAAGVQAPAAEEQKED